MTPPRRHTFTPHARHSERFARWARWASDPNDYATLQEDLEYFDHELGTIAYRRALGAPLVIADPLCARPDRARLLEAFLARHPHANFVNVTYHTARALHAKAPGRFRFTPGGTEHVLAIDRIDPLSIPPVRGALKKARKHGWRCEEADWRTLPDATVRQVAKINESFLRASTAGHELPLLARKMVLAHEPDVRLFLMYNRARSNEEESLLGFFTLDPWYRGGEKFGAQLHQIRFMPTRQWGVYLAIVAWLIGALPGEGIDHLALGACALHLANEPDDLPRFWGAELFLDLATKNLDRFHSLTNLTDMKLLFPGASIKRYMCAPTRSPLMPVLRLLIASHTISLPLSSRRDP